MSSETASPVRRFKYATFVTLMPTSSHPSRPAAFNRSSSSRRGPTWFRSIFLYSHSIMAWPLIHLVRFGAAAQSAHATTLDAANEHQNDDHVSGTPSNHNKMA